MRLKFLHAIGLTNLSDDEIIKYYKVDEEALAYSLPQKGKLYWMLISKRFIDVLFSLTMLLGLIPFIAIVALIIKLTSSGPVFTIQNRIGYNRRPFFLYKFRTKITSEDENNESDFLCHFDDSNRFTSIGRTLRKTSIDEIPQIINVLKGEMSLVGPRPLIARELNEEKQPWLEHRTSVKPGIVGLWQLDIDKGMPYVAFERWEELDIQYIDNWSIWLDIKILLRTIPAILKASSTTRLEVPIKWLRRNECWEGKEGGAVPVWR